ncbi:MAG: formylglycine-generating enzyme family protein [Candidatus Cloacimonetes bacterium]|nr:formylglycine-generating enzyme family protein [Candidatus Cloacimonadota bacterium]MDY0171319.1 formylglycine-generating enzyme family protein [Candidatus Cloacimonadaceae bacterium]
MKKHILIIAFSLLALALFAAAPVVTGPGSYGAQVDAQPNLGYLSVSYDFTADNDCFISMEVSSDGGLTFDIIPTALTGDIGAGIVPGLGKQILWYPGSESYTVVPHSNYVVKVIADDGNTAPVIPGFVFVQGGTFDQGTVSDFYMDKFETTQVKYNAAMGLSLSTPSKPASNVSWFNAIEYCNRQSYLDNLTPYYSYDSHGTDTTTWPAGWDLTDANQYKINGNSAANGYRLPTEMEWMYAAKGGHLTPGTGYNTWSGTNLEGNLVDYAQYIANNTPGGSKNVGGKLPNELGIFDMSGNVNEWVWDESAPGSGNRVRRGGAFSSPATNCAVSFRGIKNPTFGNNLYGLRVVRSAD